MTKERCTAELEELAAKGVKAVCPIQRSPGRCYPASFTPEWWDLFAHVGKECERLGMQLWAYDQVGYGNYGWLEKAASEVQDPNTRRVVVVQAEGSPDAAIRLEIPEGDLIAIRSYPVRNGGVDDEQSIVMAPPAPAPPWNGRLPRARWRSVAIVGVRPTPSFYLSAAVRGPLHRAASTGRSRSTLGARTPWERQLRRHLPGRASAHAPRYLHGRNSPSHFRERFGYEIDSGDPRAPFRRGAP